MDLQGAQAEGGRVLAGVQQQRKLCQLRPRRILYWVLWVLLFLLTVTSGIASIVIRHKAEEGVRSAYVIDGPSASGYARFSDSWMYFVATFFNISNAVDVLQTGAKPQLVEVGPFVYKFHQRRKDIIFDKTTDTISFRQHEWLEFDRDETLRRSGGKHQDDWSTKVTTLNLLFNGMRVQASKRLFHLAGSLLWRNDFERLYDVRSPKELLEGFNKTFKFVGLPIYKVNVPGIVPDLPDSKDPDMTHRSIIHLGARDAASTFSYVAWEEQSEAVVKCPFETLRMPFTKPCKSGGYPCCGQKDPVPLWGPNLEPGQWDEDANAVHGTTGEQFRPGLFSDNEAITYYFDLVRRPMRMVTTPGETKEVQGIPVRPFRTEYSTFWANATQHSPNSRYYQWGPSGLLNMSMAIGADLYMSPAHFLDSDPSLLDAVEGLRPDRDQHEFMMGVEPHTGITVAAHAAAMLSGRVQRETNILGKRDGWFPALGDRTLYVPVFWFYLELPPIPDEAVTALKALQTANSLREFLLWLCVGGVVLLLVPAVVHLVLWLRR